MKHNINDNKILYSESTKGKRNANDFRLFVPWAEGIGLDIGCGNNRFSETVYAIDRSYESDADLIQDAEKLPFSDRTFDFVFSSHCLKDFKNPLPVFQEWLRVIKPMKYLLLLLPDMEKTDRWEDVAGFQCTIPAIRKLIENSLCKSVEILTEDFTTSFGIVIQRLPVMRDRFLLVYTPYGRALTDLGQVKENDDFLKVWYNDGSAKKLKIGDIRIDGNYRHPDLLDMMGGKAK